MPSFRLSHRRSAATMGLFLVSTPPAPAHAGTPPPILVDSGARFASEASQVDRNGGRDWVEADLDNILVETGSVKNTSGGSFQSTDWLIADGFHMSNIPQNADILGFAVTIKAARVLGGAATRNVTTAGVPGTGKIKGVRLRIGGTPTGQEKEDVANLSTTPAERTFGGPTDLWGLDPDVDDLQANRFGVQLYCEKTSPSSWRFEVFFVKLTIHYSVPGSIAPRSATGFAGYVTGRGTDPETLFVTNCRDYDDREVEDLCPGPNGPEIPGSLRYVLANELGAGNKIVRFTQPMSITLAGRRLADQRDETGAQDPLAAAQMGDEPIVWSDVEHILTNDNTYAQYGDGATSWNTSRELIADDFTYTGLGHTLRQRNIEITGIQVDILCETDSTDNGPGITNAQLRFNGAPMGTPLGGGPRPIGAGYKTPTMVRLGGPTEKWGVPDDPATVFVAILRSNKCGIQCDVTKTPNDDPSAVRVYNVRMTVYYYIDEWDGPTGWDLASVDDVTIEGRDCNGDRITVQLQGGILRIKDGENLLVDNLRIRPGAVLAGTKQADTTDCIRIGTGTPAGTDVRGVLVRNCSLQWGLDESAGVPVLAEDFTLLDCIVGEGAHGHSEVFHYYAMLSGALHMSVTGCLVANSWERNPRFGIGLMDFRSNVIHNWAGPSTSVIRARLETLPKLPTSSAETGEGIAWTGIENIQTDDGDFATIGPGHEWFLTRSLIADGFPFDAFPQYTEITGFEVSVRLWRGPGAEGANVTEIILRDNGVPVGTAQSSDLLEPGFIRTVTVGGRDDRMGVTLSNSDLIAALENGAFGVQLRLETGLVGGYEVRVYYVKLTVHYSVPGKGDVVRNYYQRGPSGAGLFGGRPYISVGHELPSLVYSPEWNDLLGNDQPGNIEDVYPACDPPCSPARLGTSPQEFITDGVPVIETQEVLAHVIANAGAFPRDEVDVELIREAVQYDGPAFLGVTGDNWPLFEDQCDPQGQDVCCPPCP